MGSGLRGNELPAVAFPNARIRLSMKEIATPCGPWRAPGSNTNAFVEQCFIHELAVLAGRDHLEFLLELMGEPALPPLAPAVANAIFAAGELWRTNKVSAFRTDELSGCIGALFCRWSVSAPVGGHTASRRVRALPIHPGIQREHRLIAGPLAFGAAVRAADDRPRFDPHPGSAAGFPFGGSADNEKHAFRLIAGRRVGHSGPEQQHAERHLLAAGQPEAAQSPIPFQPLSPSNSACPPADASGC